MDKTLFVRAPGALHEAIRIKAHQAGVTMAEYVRRLLTRHVARSKA